MPPDGGLDFQERDLASLRIRIASPRPISAPVCIGMVTEIFEKAHKLAGPDLRHPRHQGIPTVNSSTCTSFSFCGIGCPWVSRASTCCWIASRMFRLAFSMVLPLLKQPAGVGL